MPISRFALVLAAVMQWLGLAGPTPSASAQEPGSGAFERFRHSFFENQSSARDGLDIASLLALQGDERRRAEDMLLKFLPDARAVIGLGELRSQQATPQLIRIFDHERKNAAEGSAFGFIFVTKALWQIQPDTRWLRALSDIMTSYEHDVTRQEAAQAFATFRHPDAVPPLLKALDDPEGLVRHHAARALLIIHGLPDKADMRRTSPDSVIIRVMAGHQPRRDDAKRDLLAAIAGRPLATQ